MMLSTLRSAAFGVDDHISSSFPSVCRSFLPSDVSAMSIFELLSNCFHSKRIGGSSKSSISQAAKNGDLQLLRRFVQTKASHVNEQNRFGRTPLHYACRHGQSEAAAILIEEGHARTDVLSKNGATPAHECCRFGHSATLRYVLQHDEGLVFTSNCFGSLPIHIAASIGHAECVEVLMDWHSPINVRNKKGMLPLHIACENGDTEMALLLLSYSPYEQLLIRDIYDSLPLHHACQNGMAQVVQKILELVEDLGPTNPVLQSPDCTGNSPFDYISKQSNIFATYINETNGSDSLLGKILRDLGPGVLQDITSREIANSRSGYGPFRDRQFPASTSSLYRYTSRVPRPPSSSSSMMFAQAHSFEAMAVAASMGSNSPGTMRSVLDPTAPALAVQPTNAQQVTSPQPMALNSNISSPIEPQSESRFSTSPANVYLSIANATDPIYRPSLSTSSTGSHNNLLRNPQYAAQFAASMGVRNYQLPPGLNPKPVALATSTGGGQSITTNQTSTNPSHLSYPNRPSATPSVASSGFSHSPSLSRESVKISPRQPNYSTTYSTASGGLTHSAGSHAQPYGIFGTGGSHHHTANHNATTLTAGNASTPPKREEPSQKLLFGDPQAAPNANTLPIKTEKDCCVS